MEFTEDDLREAKRQIDSILHKLRETIKRTCGEISVTGHAGQKKDQSI